MFHTRALNGYIGSWNKNQRMHVCKIYLSHSIHRQHVSVAIRTIIKVTYKNIMNPYFLAKCE